MAAPVPASFAVAGGPRGPSDPLTAALPSGVQVGDRLLAFLRIDEQASNFSPNAPTLPTGWVVRGNTTFSSARGRVLCYERIADGTSADTPTFVTSDTHDSDWDVLMVRITGHDPAASIIIQAGDNTGSEPMLHQAVTLPAAGDYLTLLYGGGYQSWAGEVVEEDSGTFTLDYNSNTDSGTPSRGSFYLLHREDAGAAAGPIGPFNVSIPGAAILQRHGTFTVAIAGLSGGGGTDPTFKAFWAEDTTLVIQ